ncbi:MAG: transposase family protein, partial [bacterium]
YSLNSMVFCDDKSRIRHLVTGYAGSWHDNRIWTNTKIYQNSENYFSGSEYAIADSALTNSNIMVSAYKRSAGSTMPIGKKWFNEILSKPRVKVENCIGIWKGRFPYLRNIRVKLKQGTKSMRRIMHITHATAILHNLLIDHNVPDTWIDENFLPVEGDPINNELLEGIRGDEKRSLVHDYLDNTIG